MDNFNIKKFFKSQYLNENTSLTENDFNLSLTQGELETLKEALNCLADFHNMNHEDNEEMAMNYRSILSKIGMNENTDLTEGMDSGTDVDTMTDVGTYVVDTLNDFLDPGKMITFEVEYNDDMSISVMHGIYGQRVRENDDIQAKVNATSKVQSKGGAERDQAEKGYGDKPNKSGKGKALKRRMNKRNRKDAKQALKDA